MSQSVALFHDCFAIRGGGERLVLTLANAFDATLIHGYRIEDSYPASDFPRGTRALDLPPFLRRSGLRPPALALSFSAQRARARNFNVRIFSGVAAPFAAPDRGQGGVNIYYCHTPPRFIYDQRRHSLNELSASLRPMTSIGLRVFERGYRRAISRMDVIVANSENVRNRIARYLDRDSIVVFPPVDIDRFGWQGQDGYYLSTARLSPLKRVDRIVDAFLKLPDKNLVVVSGGQDLDELKGRAAGAPNITFRGWVSDAELRTLVGKAIATIYLPRDEDFGMSPVESMAAGKPVIGVAEGGLLETVIPHRTGILLAPDFSEADLIAAVDAMTREKALSLREACEIRARDFSRDRFVAGMHSVISGALQEAGL